MLGPLCTPGLTVTQSGSRSPPPGRSGHAELIFTEASDGKRGRRAWWRRVWAQEGGRQRRASESGT